MSNTIPTADVWLDAFGSDADEMYYKSSVQEAMIEFAKLHVEAALKASAEKAELEYDSFHKDADPWINRDSILSAYPLDQIK